MSLFVDKAGEAIAIIEHGAAYKGQQDHQVDVFGAKAGIDAKPQIGFGDAVRSDEEEMRRKKRQNDLQSMNQQQDDQPNEVHNIFQEMWQCLAEGAKKIMKKFTDNGEQQQQSPQEQKTY